MLPAYIAPFQNMTQVTIQDNSGNFRPYSDDVLDAEYDVVLRIGEVCSRLLLCTLPSKSSVSFHVVMIDPLNHLHFQAVCNGLDSLQQPGSLEDGT